MAQMDVWVLIENYMGDVSVEAVYADKEEAEREAAVKRQHCSQLRAYTVVVKHFRVRGTKR